MPDNLQAMGQRVGRVISSRLFVRMLLSGALAANAVLVGITVYGFFVSEVGHDWAIYVEAGHRAGTQSLYRWDQTYAWSYSPIMAYVFGVLTPIGYAGWTILHVVALAALRNPWLAFVSLISWPFWVDIYNGNTMVFVFVAAAMALRGSTTGTLAYMILSLMMPRPLMLPLLAWIVWRRPEWRARSVVVLLLYGGLLLLSGQGIAWLHALTSVGDAVAVSARDIGPSLLLGTWWLVFGGLLAIVLTAYGRVGLASIAVSPYWLPQYLMMVLLEMLPWSSRMAPRVSVARSSPD